MMLFLVVLAVIIFLALLVISSLVLRLVQIAGLVINRIVWRHHTEFIKKISPAIVRIRVFQRARAYGGSGFFIDDEGHLLTNHHVVEDANQIFVFLQNGKKYKARLVGQDAEKDIALLKIEADVKLPFLSFADSSLVNFGELTILLARPDNLWLIVSGGPALFRQRLILPRYGIKGEFLMIDSWAKHGTSGGPFVNLVGQVIGINCASMRYGFLIELEAVLPADVVLDVLPELKKGKGVAPTALD